MVCARSMDSDSHSGDVRRELQMCEHLERKDADPVPGDTPITVRFMEPSEATQLARCVFRSYGSSYDADWVYRPDQIAERIESGLLH